MIELNKIYNEREIKLRLEPTKKEICMMCHWSSGCDNCCDICKSKCNSEQVCMQKKGDQNDEFKDDQFERFEAWLSIQQELGYKI